MDWLESLLNPYNLQVVMLVFLNCMLAMSTWIPLSAGQLSLGAGGFMSIGAYTAALLTMKAGWPIVPAIFLASIVTSVVAFLLGYPILRLHGVYLAIATLAFGETVRIFALNLRITNGALGLAGIPQMVDEMTWRLYDIPAFADAPPPFDPHTVASLVMVFILFLIVAFAVFALVRQGASRTGRALQAIKTDEMAAQAMGIDIAHYKLLAFTQSGFLAGLAGGLYAHLYYFIGPNEFGFNRAIETMLYVVLGGMETVWGALFGAAGLTILPELLRFSSSYRTMVYGAALVIFMIFRPQGFISRAAVERLGARWRRQERPAKREGVRAGAGT